MRLIVLVDCGCAVAPVSHVSPAPFWPTTSHFFGPLSPLRNGNTFHIATSGDDGNVKIISIECTELSNPTYEPPHDPPQGIEAVAHFFFKGAGIPRAVKKKKEEPNKENVTEEADMEAAMLGEEDMDMEDMDMDDEESEVEDQYVCLPLPSQLHVLVESFGPFFWGHLFYTQKRWLSGTKIARLSGSGLGVVATHGGEVHLGAQILGGLLPLRGGLWR